VIYVVEIPEHGDPRAWFAYDEADFERKVVVNDPLQGWEIHDELTARELLGDLGHAAVDETARERFPSVCALGDEHGWDTPLYRADHLLGRGVVQAEPVSARQALTAALLARGGTPCIYWDEADALRAFEGADPRLAGPQRWRARRALHEQLVALDVLADDN